MIDRPDSRLLLRLHSVAVAACAVPLPARVSSHGGELRVYADTTKHQLQPRVAADDSGRFPAVWPSPGSVAATRAGDFVAWTSNGSTGGDDGASVEAQRYDALFGDGFEGGDAGPWSGSVP